MPLASGRWQARFKAALKVWVSLRLPATNGDTHSKPLPLRGFWANRLRQTGHPAYKSPIWSWVVFAAKGAGKPAGEDSRTSLAKLWHPAPVARLRRQQGGCMAESDKVFAGSLPQFYDRLMVPLIFEDYAADLAALVAAWSPGAVLETAAGSGVVARRLAPQLASDACYVVTDLSQPMLDYAASRQGADSRIAWRQADALALPFEDASFDVVCCQFGAMFFPSRVAGYAEARRVLRPGGRFVFSVWDRIEENVFADEVTRALATLFPQDPPRFLARTPHGYHDTRTIQEEASRAGFTNILIETRAKLSHAPSASAAASAYCQGTPLRNEIEARDASLLQVATDRATQAITSRHGAGPVAGKIQAHVIVAGG
jgi:ubiquinone/menaquinone biosynthesis C-methylase UbiE